LSKTVINWNRKPKQVYLTDRSLDWPVYERQSLAVAVGDFFEYVAHALVDGSHVGYTAGNVDCCPDLVRGDVLYESKASCKSEFLCYRYQTENYRAAMDADPYCQVYYWFFDYSKGDTKLSGRFKTKRELFAFLCLHVQRALLLPLSVVEALSDNAEFARHGEGHTWYAGGEREVPSDYYRFKVRGIKAIHENNGWMEKAQIPRADYVVVQHVTAPIEMQFEASTFAVAPFRVLGVHPKVKRPSNPIPPGERQPSNPVLDKVPF